MGQRWIVGIWGSMVKLPKTNGKPTAGTPKLVVWVDVSPFPFGGIFSFHVIHVDWVMFPCCDFPFQRVEHLAPTKAIHLPQAAARALYEAKDLVKCALTLRELRDFGVDREVCKGGKLLSVGDSSGTMMGPS